jgi:hypothetical protein
MSDVVIHTGAPQGYERAGVSAVSNILIFDYLNLTS